MLWTALTAPCAGRRIAGPLYYIYMSMLSTFCTNSINILAGVNGVEVSDTVQLKSCLRLIGDEDASSRWDKPW